MIRRLSDWLGRALFPGSREVPARDVAGESSDFLNPYRPEDAREAGEAWRDTWSTEPVIAARAEVAVEGRVSPGSRPLTHNSQAGVQAWKGAVR